ncbi:MAG: hypothetical protein ABH864_05240 [archaeon]
MKKRRLDAIREWINTAIAAITLILLILGMIFGIGELREIRVSLDKLEFNQITDFPVSCPEGCAVQFINFSGGNTICSCFNQTAP